MNKNTMIVIGVILLAVVGGGIFLVNQQYKNTQEAVMQKDISTPHKNAAIQEEIPEQEALEKQGETMMKKDVDKISQSNSSRYVEYSKTVLDQAADKRRVLYFYATWCPSCKVANEDFTANQNKIPQDVVVIRTNYNDPNTDQEEKDLARKYGITYQHTFVQIDARGNEITKWNGGQTDELVANIK